jgi:hypothetical protein
MTFKTAAPIQPGIGRESGLLVAKIQQNRRREHRLVIKTYGVAAGIKSRLNAAATAGMGRGIGGKN